MKIIFALVLAALCGCATASKTTYIAVCEGTQPEEPEFAAITAAGTHMRLKAGDDLYCSPAVPCAIRVETK